MTVYVIAGEHRIARATAFTNGHRPDDPNVVILCPSNIAQVIRGRRITSEDTVIWGHFPHGMANQLVRCGDAIKAAREL